MDEPNEHLVARLETLYFHARCSTCEGLGTECGAAKGIRYQRLGCEVCGLRWLIVCCGNEIDKLAFECPRCAAAS